MRYNSVINNIKAKEWNLTIQQAYLFSWFYELPSWANKVMIENEIFYFASKTKAVEELPILTDKTDTMYRYYKQLEEKNLLVIKKIDNKDYISLTEKGKEWNFCKSDYSENNPTLLGNLSENNSDLNPTYNIHNTNNNTNNNIDKEKLIFFKDCFWNSYENLKSELSKDEVFKKDFAGVDLKFYINEADTWSESKRVKRTERGWYLTLRKFMREAKQIGKLQINESFKKIKGGHTNH
jgi:hypothetical protein